MKPVTLLSLLSTIAYLAAADTIPQADILLKLHPPEKTTYLPTAQLLLQEDYTAYMTAIRTSEDSEASTFCWVTALGLEKAHCVDAPSDSYFQQAPQPMYSSFESESGSPECALAFSQLLSGLTPTRTDTSVVVRLCAGNLTEDLMTSAVFETEPGYTIQRAASSLQAGSFIAVRIIRESSPGQITTYITLLDTSEAEEGTISVEANNSVVFTNPASPRVLSPSALNFMFVNSSVIFLVQDATSSKLIRSDMTSNIWAVPNPCGLVAANREIGLADFYDSDSTTGTEDVSIVLWGRDVQNKPKLCRLNIHGHEVWPVPPTVSITTVTNVLIDSDRVVVVGYVDAQSSAIIVLSGKDGSLVWQTLRTADDLNQSTPVLRKGFAYFTVHGMLAYRKLDLASAQTTQTQLECTMTPGVEDGAVYCIDGAGNVIAYDLAEDKTIWEATVDEHSAVMQPPQAFPQPAGHIDDAWVAWVEDDGSIIFATAPAAKGQQPNPTAHEGSLPTGSESTADGSNSQSGGSSSEANEEHVPEGKGDDDGKAMSKFIIVTGIIATLVGGVMFVLYRRRQNARRLGLMYESTNNTGYDATTIA